MGNREIKRKMRDAKRLVTVSLCSFERLVMNELLKTEHLSVSFFTDAGEVEAVRDVSFTVRKGEVLAIVGESGCGKSALCKSIMKLLPKTAKIKSGKILVNGVDITDYTEKNMSRLRGELFSMVFQDPMTSLNPTITVGKQIGEAVRIHNKKMPKKQVKEKVLELMQLVEIDEPEVRISQYPHEFSGGQRQRLCIARALEVTPEVLICDEPVSALDVSVQAQVLNLLQELKEKLGLTYFFISHNLNVVYQVSDRVGVMYLGNFVEVGEKEKIYSNPMHPYTQALLSAVPVPDPTAKRERILLEGSIPSAHKPPTGCKFHTRCPKCMECCKTQAPERYEVDDGHYVYCHLYDKERREQQK